MRVIDQDEIEFDLPGNWDQTVTDAWTYVTRKINEAEQGINNQAIEKEWECLTKIEAYFTVLMKRLTVCFR